MLIARVLLVTIGLIYAHSVHGQPAADMGWPYFAFNSGMYDGHFVREMTGKNRIRIAKEDASFTTIEHEQVEVFQRNGDTTRGQETVYALIASTFQLTWSEQAGTLISSRDLSQVSVEFVYLDWAGAPRGVKTQKFLVRQNEQGAWSQSPAEGTCIDQFYGNLSPRQRTTLSSISGLLNRRPGYPPIAYRKSMLEKALFFAELGIPSYFQNYLAQVAEGYAKREVFAELERLVTNGELKWGMETSLDDALYIYTEDDRKTGERTMQQCHCVPAAPTNLRVQ